MKIKQDTDGDEAFFDTETVTKFDIPEDATTTWSSLLSSFQTFFVSLVSGVSDHSTQAFGIMRDVRTLGKGLDDVGSDLETLDVHLQAVQGQVGETIKIGGVEVPNLSAGLGVLMERIKHNDILINQLTGELSTSLDQIVQDQKNTKLNK